MFQKTTLILLLLTIVSCKNNESSEKDKIKTANFLLGEWENNSDNGNLSENWTKVNDSVFSGESYFIKGKDTLHSEKMELKQKGENLIYSSTIKGQNNNESLSFAYNPAVEKALVFENPKNDYPKKIVYKPLSKDHLIIEISGTQQGKQSSTQYSLKKKN